jgi:hypothetical protein
MADDPRPGDHLTAFETDAEFLVLDQLDLLAQVEAQLRAVHHTMRRIEKLRGAKHRVGPELPDKLRQDTLHGLTAELEALDAHFATQHECSRHMLTTVERMRQRLASVKRGDPPSPREATPPRSRTHGETSDAAGSGVAG